MIAVNNLTKRFGRHVALDGVTFNVPRGSVVGLLGPNGAGKTTCLRIIAGYLAPTSGTVCVSGQDLVHGSPAIRRTIGYLPEGAPLDPDMRVNEYLQLRAQLLGLRSAKDELSRCLERSGVATCKTRPIRELSRGYRQRVAFAAALIGRPQLLLLDEPTSALDPNQQRAVRDTVRELAGETTIVWSSHLLAEVEEVCDKVVIIDRGKVVADDTVDAICRTDITPVAKFEIRAQAEAVRQQIEALPGVSRVVIDEHLPSTKDVVTGRVVGEISKLLLERIADEVHKHGWALRQLSQHRGQLEQLFVRLTSSDTPDREV